MPWYSVVRNTCPYPQPLTTSCTRLWSSLTSAIRSIPGTPNFMLCLLCNLYFYGWNRAPQNLTQRFPFHQISRPMNRRQKDRPYVRTRRIVRKQWSFKCALKIAFIEETKLVLWDIGVFLKINRDISKRKLQSGKNQWLTLHCFNRGSVTRKGKLPQPLSRLHYASCLTVPQLPEIRERRTREELLQHLEQFLLTDTVACIRVDLVLRSATVKIG